MELHSDPVKMFGKEPLGHVGVAPLLESDEHSGSDDEYVRLKCSSGSPDKSVVQMPDGPEVELFDDTTPHFHSELLPVREEIVSERQPCYDSLGTMLSDS